MFDHAIWAFVKKHNITTKVDENVMSLLVGHRKDLVFAYSKLIDLKKIKESAKKVFRSQSELVDFLNYASEKGVKYENLMRFLDEYSK